MRAWTLCLGYASSVLCTHFQLQGLLKKNKGNRGRSTSEKSRPSQGSAFTLDCPETDVSHVQLGSQVAFCCMPPTVWNTELWSGSVAGRRGIWSNNDKISDSSPVKTARLKVLQPVSKPSGAEPRLQCKVSQWQPHTIDCKLSPWQPHTIDCKLSPWQPHTINCKLSQWQPHTIDYKLREHCLTQSTVHSPTRRRRTRRRRPATVRRTAARPLQQEGERRQHQCLLCPVSRCRRECRRPAME